MRQSPPFASCRQSPHALAFGPLLLGDVVVDFFVSRPPALYSCWVFWVGGYVVEHFVREWICSYAGRLLLVFLQVVCSHRNARVRMQQRACTSRFTRHTCGLGSRSPSHLGCCCFCSRCVCIHSRRCCASSRVATVQRPGTSCAKLVMAPQCGVNARDSLARLRACFQVARLLGRAFIFGGISKNYLQAPNLAFERGDNCEGIA